MAVPQNFTFTESQFTTTPLVQQSVNNLTSNNFNVDILWRNSSTGSNATWLMNGTTHEAGLMMVSRDPSWKIAAIADFNRNGQDDILWRNSLTGQNAIWVMRDSSTIQEGVWLIQVHDTKWKIESTADFNRDGQVDILWRNYQTGQNAIWEMNCTNLSRGVFITQVHDTNWKIESTADFNRDGQVDILWRNYQTGQNAIWEMNGSNLKNGIWLESRSTNWQIKATADLNGDGQVDILWRNYQTGQNSVWQMNGTNLRENVVLTTIGDTDWQIAGVIKRNTIENNNTLSTASDLGVINGLRTITNYVGNNDVDDYYRFTVNSPSRFSLDLFGLIADVDVELFDANGRRLTSSEKEDTSNESIRRELAAGNYYVRVYRYGSANSCYTLNLSLLSGFNSTYGYGLVNADNAVSRALGQNLNGNNSINTSNWSRRTGGNWGNDAINAPNVWSRGYTGKDITVAVIDDGVFMNHPDLSRNIWRNPGEIRNGIDSDRNSYVDDINGWNFSTGINGNNSNINPVTDSRGEWNSHGTHVAGTIAAANNGEGITGVAYDSQIMGLRIGRTEERYFLDTGNLATAIRYAVDNGARVINMSLGLLFASNELERAFAYAASRNVMIVVAAGNDAGSFPYAPAYLATNYGISVGAININGNITYFSNRAGYNPDMLHVVAPGEDIKSTVAGSISYANYRGTSMAAPHVAGTVALILDANPHLSHAQIRQIIAETATRIN